MSAIVQYFEHSLALPFFETGMKTALFQSCGHRWVFQICWHIECITTSDWGLLESTSYLSCFVCLKVPTHPMMGGHTPPSPALATHQLDLRLGLFGSSQSDRRGALASSWVQLSPPALWRWRPVPRSLKRKTPSTSVTCPVSVTLHQLVTSGAV